MVDSSDFPGHSRGVDATIYSAEKYVRIVSAMEAREGPNTQDKAEQLMAVTCHLFEDMMATYHPPGEVAEQSSNTQCAFRQFWKKYCVDLHQRDFSSVFITVGDADTLQHPQFFTSESLSVGPVRTGGLVSDEFGSLISNVRENPRRDSENEQMRILQERQEEQIIVDCRAKNSQTRVPSQFFAEEVGKLIILLQRMHNFDEFNYFCT